MLADYSDALHAFRANLLARGYVDVAFETSHEIILKRGSHVFMASSVVHILQWAAAIKSKLGDEKAAKALDEEAKKVYVTANGVVWGWKGWEEKAREAKGMWFN